MGKKLVQIYNIIEEKCGMTGRIQLVSKTGVPRNVAAEMTDDPEVLEKFKKTASDILGADIGQYLP